MLTLKELVDGTLRLLKLRNKKEPRWKFVSIEKALLEPIEEDDALIYVTNVKGETDRYRAVVMFTEIDVVKTNSRFKGDAKHGKLRSSNGNYYSVEYPKAKTTPVSVRCSCEDYYFRWAYWNKKVGSLYGGALKRYHRITKHRPPVNPLQTPGMCKHCWRMMVDLRKMGVLK